jgi:hypothetical protein
VRVGDHRRHAARDDRPCELRGDAQAALDVDVGVDEAGRDVRAADVDAPLALIPRPDPRDASVDDRNVDAGLDLAGEDVDHPPPAHDEVGRRLAAGDGEQQRYVLHHRIGRARRLARHGTASRRGVTAIAGCSRPAE